MFKKKEIRSFATHVGNYTEICSNTASELQVSTALVTRDTHAKYKDTTTEPIVTTMVSTENDGLYQIPKSFKSVSEILDHWDSIVARDQRRYKFAWRKHLIASETKKFSQINKIVHTIKDRVMYGETNTLPNFEEYYASNGYSLGRLSDVYIKSLAQL